ncbi:MAG: response regulator transcription factor, partial [Niameybacter sp.]
MKILIVDDHDIVRKGIAAMLGCEDNFEEIQEAGSLDEGMKKLTIDLPDIALIDVNLAGKNGLDIIEQAREKQIDTKFVVLTSSSRKGDFLRAKELEVDGYILKDSNVEDIIYAIKSIARGRKFYDAQIVEQSKQ